MSTVLFITGVAALVATLLALFRVRHPSALSVPVMAISWLTGELAVLHLALQVIASIALVAFGALDATIGWIGLGAMVLSWIGLVYVQHVAGRARSVLADVLGEHYPDAADRVRADHHETGVLLRPFHFDTSELTVESDIAYGPDTAHRLDIYRPNDSEGRNLPVFVYIHGGAWVSGKKEQQGLPLIHAMASAGWVCIAIEYRLAKKHRFPAQIDDVRRAITWVHEHVGEHGGDASFLAVSGGSAGGHLAALASTDDEVGSLISACIPIYGAFDFTDHLQIRGYARMRPFLERMVMPSKLADDSEAWQAASPIFQVAATAPPFLVIHGRIDVFIWREETEAYVTRLSEVAREPVVYAELPGAQHAFDMFHSVRTAATVDAIHAFCDAVHTTASPTTRRPV